MENEGQAPTNHLCSKVKCSTTRSKKMIILFELCHINMVNMLENGKYILVDDSNQPLPRTEWTDLRSDISP